MPEIVIHDNVALHYQCVGEGQDLVMIHGLGANLAFWYPGIAATLAEQYRIIVYDLRGHGRSAMTRSGYTMPQLAHDLEGLLTELGVNQAHVVGHSFGAGVAMHYAVYHPDRVKTLTLADAQIRCLQSLVRLRDWPHWNLWKQQLEEQNIPLPSEDEVINFEMLSRLSRVYDRAADADLGARKRNLSVRRRQLGRRSLARWDQLLDETEARQEFNNPERITPADIQALDMPILAIYGEYSHCLQSCRGLKKLIPHAEVAIIPKVGHFHPVVRPRLFLHILRQFLAHQTGLDPAPDPTLLDTDLLIYSLPS